MQAIERENDLPHRAKVRVHVTVVKGTEGLKFLVDAKIQIPEVSHDTAVDFVHQAEKRCPVSKLLSNNGNYTLEVVD